MPSSLDPDSPAATTVVSSPPRQARALATIGGLRSPLWRDALVLAAILAAWSAFFGHTRTLEAGYHLTDDHEILRLVDELRRASGLHVAREWITRDLGIRFRPFYYLHRVLEAAVMGDDLIAWSRYVAALAVGATALLYLALRAWRFPAVAALAFAFLSTFGEQAPIWWRLGPSETVGMACLAAALYGLARWSGGAGWGRALFWVAAALASLCKESFTLLLPALGLATVWSIGASRGWTVRRALRACAPDLAYLGVLLAAELAVILLWVGTERIGYAGVQGVGAKAVLATAAAQLRRPDLLLAGAVALLGLCARGWPTRAALRSALLCALLAAAVVGPQAFLYAKSGIAERYLVPGALGVALMVACAIRWALGGERPAGPWRRALRLALPALALGLLARTGAARVSQASEAAAGYAQDGRDTDAFLSVLSRNPGPLLVAGGIPGISEHFWSIRWYLRLRSGREDVRFLFLPPDAPLDPFLQRLAAAFRRDPLLRSIGAGDAPPGAIGILPGAEARFRETTRWLGAAPYQPIPLGGGYAAYTRR